MSAAAGKPGDGDAPVPEFSVITGMSGAGRSTAADALEDLGWYVVDNLPPSLLPRLAELGGRPGDPVSRIAVVVDVRSLAFFTDWTVALDELAAMGIARRTVFLEAADDVLVRRFEAVRRPHPLQGGGRILDGISAERELLGELRDGADVVIDTTALNVHQLATRIASTFSGEGVPGLRATVMSFGYKYGLPVDADLVVDCRFLPNPHWLPDLRPLTGRDESVRDYVLGQPGALPLVNGFADLLEIIATGYEREGKRYVTVAVGCTGGKHRSVAIAEALATRLSGDGMQTSVVHRDLGRE